MRYFRLIGLTVLFLAGVCAAEEAGFVRNIVDFDVPDIEGTDFSLAVDADNIAHLVYTRTDGNTDWSLTHAAAYPGSYTYDLLPENSFGIQRNPFLSITPDGQFSLALGHDTFSIFGSKSAWYDWVYSPLPPGQVVSMVVSENGKPYLLMNDSGDTYFVWFDIQTGLWARERNTSVGYGFSPLTMDIAQDGRIMAVDSGVAGIFITIKSQNGWDLLPPLEGHNGCGSFLPDGTAAVAYTAPDGRVHYAVYIEGGIGWISSPCGQYTEGQVLALDHTSTGIAGIIYLNNNTLYYAANTGAGWTQSLVDDSIIASPGARLAFDNAGKPLIAYLSQTAYMPVLKLAGLDLTPYCISDINHDGRVDLADFAVLSQNWMRQLPADQSSPADIDRNHWINEEDLFALINFWLWPTN